MWRPRKLKYKKYFKPQVVSTKFERKMLGLDLGVFGLMALESGWITSSQLEAAWKVILKWIKNKGKLWIMFFPDKGVTQKPAEVRMGKGKGGISYWVALILKGKILFEIWGAKLSSKGARYCLTKAGERLPIKTKVIVNKM